MVAGKTDGGLGKGTLCEMAQKMRPAAAVTKPRKRVTKKTQKRLEPYACIARRTRGVVAVLNGSGPPCADVSWTAAAVGRVTEAADAIGRAVVNVVAAVVKESLACGEGGHVWALEGLMARIVDEWEPRSDGGSEAETAAEAAEAEAEAENEATEEQRAWAESVVGSGGGA